MDIHRCRFIPYPPQAITSLTFSHAPNPSEKAPLDLRLALGRENGDVEIWNPFGGSWVQESILRSSAGKAVEQLAWTQDLEINDEGSETTATPGKLRLFSTDGTPSITEWDIAKGTKRRHAEGNFGDIWCFAAQPPYKLSKDGKVDAAPLAQLLVGGCGDGNIVLFTTDEDDLRFLRLLSPSPGKKHKILSITWRDRNTVVAGYQDGMIRITDVHQRQLIRTMTLGKTPDGGKSIVWALKCLPDGTILSGDSSGELKIWDAKNFSCTQRLKTHQGDILDIVSNAKGDLVFTVAVDRRTVAYKPVASQQGRRAQRWTSLMHRRYHEHDVKCAAAFESKGLSFLVSGGADTTPVVLPMHNWQSEYHRTLSHLPQRPQMSVSPKSRLLLSWWQRDLHIHHIAKRSHDGVHLSEPDFAESHNYQQLATLRLSGDEHIHSAQISYDGKFIVASTATGVRLFQLRRITSNGSLSLRTRPVELPAALRSFGARHVGFSDDGRWLLAIRLDSTILLAKVVVSEDTKERPSIHDRMVRLSHKTRKQSPTGLEDYTKTINTFTFSPDSRVLAVADLSGTIDAWVLEGQEDLTYTNSDGSQSSSSSSDSDSDSDDDEDSDSPIIHGQRWIRTPQDTSFPRLDSPVLAIAFRPPAHPHSQDTSSPIGLHPTRHNAHPLAHMPPPSSTSLVAITANHTLIELDILTGKLTSWARRNPSSLLPQPFTRLRDRIMGVFWDTSHDRQRLWMYGPRWMYMLDLAHDLPSLKTENNTKSPSQEEQSSPTKKRKRRHSRSQRDRGTGAGGNVKPSDRDQVGYGSLAMKYKGIGDEDAMDLIDLDQKLEPASDEEELSLQNDALVKLRRGITDHDQAQQADTAMHGAQSNGDTLSTGEAHSKTIATKPKGKEITYYHTHHYRDIFGVAVLSSHTSHPDTEGRADPSPASSYATAHSALGHNAKGDLAVNGQYDGAVDGPAEGYEEIDQHSNGLEIIIVERPMHDVDLPPRFDGGQDWDS